MSFILFRGTTCCLDYIYWQHFSYEILKALGACKDVRMCGQGFIFLRVNDTKRSTWKERSSVTLWYHRRNSINSFIVSKSQAVTQQKCIDSTVSQKRTEAVIAPPTLWGSERTVPGDRGSLIPTKHKILSHMFCVEPVCSWELQGPKCRSWNRVFFQGQDLIQNISKLLIW